MEKRIIYFEKPGPTNTEKTLGLALEEAKARNIGKIVLASTRGVTAVQAADLLAGTSIKLVVVPHQFGFMNYKQHFTPETVEKLEAQGHKVHFGTMLFHTDGFYGSGTPEAMAMVLRTICQGIKVAVEIVLMAADGGHLAPGEEVVVVTGTGRGADTAVIAQAATSSKLQDLHITEILCKPLTTYSWPRGTSPHDPPKNQTRTSDENAD